MKEAEKTNLRHADRRRSRRVAGPARLGRRRDQRTRAFWRRRALGVAATATCGLLAVVVALGYLGTGGGEIRRGVEAGGVKLGGMTRDEAREAITRRASTALGEIELVGGGERIVLSGEDLGVEVDAAATAEEAYAVGRRGGTFARLSNALSSYLGGAVQVPADAEYDEGDARSTLADVARGLDREPEDAYPTVGENGKVEVRGGEEGRILDQEATLARLDRSLDGLQGEIPLAMRTNEPEVSTEEARALAPTRLVGEYKTDFAWDPDPGRQANLKMASGAIDNTLLAPGETFSAIEVLEPLDYEEAKVFADGGVSSGVGGGLCQVTSTLYMAASYAGLDIVERNPHYALLPYISPGFDATVWFGGSGIEPLDMKFKNNTGGYVMIREYVDEDGFLTAQVYAQKPMRVNVEMKSEKTEEDLQKGITWATSKKVTTQDGEVLSDEVLHEDTYSYNPPVPVEMQHETNEPRTSGWADPTNTTGWASVD